MYPFNTLDVDYYCNRAIDVNNRCKLSINTSINCAKYGQLDICKNLAINVKENLRSISHYNRKIREQNINISDEQKRSLCENIIYSLLYYWIVTNSIKKARQQNILNQIQERNQQHFIYY